jgi:integrase
VFLESDELARFNDALKNEPSADLRDFLILALATGAGRGNILGMRWANIAWEREAWVVPFAKNGRSYEVQLTRPALTVLRRRRDLAAEDSTFVFPGIGATGHLINVNKLWHVFRTRAKLQHIRLHSLRHTAASYLAQSGASLQVIGAALGHASLGSTEVYSHLISQTVRDAREASERKMLESVKSAKARQKKALASRRARPALTA